MIYMSRPKSEISKEITISLTKLTFFAILRLPMTVSYTKMEQYTRNQLKKAYLDLIKGQ